MRRSIPHLQKVFESYLHKHQLSIIDVVKKETSGCLKKGYKTIGTVPFHFSLSILANGYILTVTDLPVERKNKTFLKGGMDG